MKGGNPIWREFFKSKFSKCTGHQKMSKINKRTVPNKSAQGGFFFSKQ